jgi:putative lipoprotein
MAATSQRNLIGTSWRAEDIGGRGVVDNAQTTLTFDGEGRVTGSGGCNRYFGPATLQGDSISFGGIGSTRMACPPARMEQEQAFFAALAATRSYRFDESGQNLLFLGEDGAVLVRLRPLTS